jgi:serine/threonine protein kinase
VFVVCADPRRLAEHVNAVAHALIADNDYHRILDTRGDDCRHRPREIRNAAPDGMVRWIPLTPCGITSTYCVDLFATQDGLPSLHIFHAPLFMHSGLIGSVWMSILAEQNVDCVVGTHEEPPASVLDRFVLYEVHRKYSEKADVYSFAIVMWEVLTRKAPYQDKNMMTVALNVINGDRPPVPADCPKAFGDIMQRAWKAKPDRRPTMDDLLMYFNSELGTDRV